MTSSTRPMMELVLSFCADEQEISTSTSKAESEGHISTNVLLSTPVVISSKQQDAMSKYSEAIDEDIMTKVKKLGKRLFSCRVCGFIRHTLEAMRGHLTIHRQGNPYRCPLFTCSKLYPTLSSLRKHLEIHAPQKIRCGGSDEQDNLDQGITKKTEKMNFVCIFCPLGFANKSSIEAHLRSHTKEQKLDSRGRKRMPALSQCKNCSYTTTMKGDLRKHMLTHRRVRQYKCSLCTKTFAGKEERRIHMMMHLKEKDFKCVICDKGFATRHDLNGHIKTHSGKKYPCPKCDGKFSTNRYRLIHLQKAHGIGSGSRKVYVCYFCQKEFYKHSGHVNHLRVHTLEAPYRCTEVGCLREFKTSVNLGAHIKSNHVEVRKMPRKHPIETSDGRFQCRMCTKIYNDKEEACQHVKIAHDDRPMHKCTALGCRYSTKRKYELKRHLTQVHQQFGLSTLQSL